MVTTVFPSIGQDFARFSGESRLALGDIDVQPISDSAWRVRDIRLPEFDALCVLGVIEKQPDGTYGALRIGRGFTWETFATLHAATAHFADTTPGGTDR